MEEEENSPPFWLQSSSSLPRSTYNGHRRLSRASSFLLNSAAVLISLLVILLCFILIVVPRFLEFVSQLLRPQSVKKSWDSLNLLLVFFAIVCGFLSRNTREDKGSFDDGSASSMPAMKSNPSTPRRWYEISDDRTTIPAVNRLRSSSSYPDLRLQEPSWSAADDRWKFYDDTHLLSNHRFPSADQLRRRHEARPELENNRSEIHGEEVYLRPASSSPPRSPSPPARVTPPRSPSPPVTVPTPPAKTHKVVKRRPKNSQLIHRPGKEINYQWKNVVSEVADYQRLQLPPLSPPSFYQESEQKSSKNEKKRGGATKEFLISLRRMKKKQRQKSIESFEAIINVQRPSTSQSPRPSPPPPPPLPPPSVFHTLFSSKKVKTKRAHSASPPQLHPPSMAPEEPKPESEDQNHLIKPRDLPSELERLSSLNNDQEYNSRTGSDSPLHPIPPPPPPPPFKMPDWKFAAHGDFISIRSNSSSPRAVSPDLDESEADGRPVRSSAGVNDSSAPVFCPSPDVNSKADNFIARFRADLKLQKMNSIKEKKARRRSNLGREPGPGPE